MNKIVKNLLSFLIVLCCFQFPSLAQTSSFQYGVASGDATSHFVVLWTHVSNVFTDSAMVLCQVANDSVFKDIILSNNLFALKQKGFTAKIDIGPLKAEGQYFYRFIAQSDTSIVGVTYTLPEKLTTNFKIGFASCANYEAGYFNAYEALSAMPNLKALVHLGDYIYEYASGEYAYNKKSNRHFEPKHELVSLHDYRTRYQQYRKDSSLAKLHQKVPFYCIWDDHEFADDAHSEGAENHNIQTEGTWEDRSDAAKQAYFEWMPIRENEAGSIYRKLNIGKLVSLFFLDTRMDSRELGGQMMSKTQQNWYHNALKQDSSIWKITIQQVMMAPLSLFGIPMNPDQWDGFGKSRNELLNFIKNENIQNYVVLSGDFHSSWASELKLENEILGREIVCPGITSPALNIPFVKHIIPLANPHIKFTDLKNRGFVTLDITPVYISSNWHFLETVDKPSAKIKSVNTLFLPVNQLVFNSQLPIESTVVLDQD